MDQSNVSPGRGRGRGYILQQAVQEAASACRMAPETNVGKTSTTPEGDKPTISDEDIKNWLKQALTKSKGGIWEKYLPKSFSENFKANAPDDLIAKILCWSEVFQIDSILGGNIVRLSDLDEFPAGQKENAKESVPNVPDNFIRIWLKKELRKRQSGIPTADIPSLFKETFHTSAPEDLITKLRSWPDVVQIQSVQGRDIMTLTPRASPSRDHMKPQGEDIQVTKERISTLCIPEEGTYLDVHVKWSESPTLFCCIPYNHHQKLNTMMQELNAYLNAEANTIPKAALVQGDVYAGNYDHTWYRVIFKGFSEDNMLSMDHLQELPSRFRNLPFGSFKARLQGVDPADGSNQWSDKAKESLAIITRGRDFVCLICDRPDDHEVVSVRLVDTSDEDDVVVDEIMEDLDLVVRSPSYQHAPFEDDNE
ncbi:tudor domain-containing protein 7-like isoform X2 [Haliotis asinina]|uniref:tudor domain-containing protein 7-like isoform X2 n=1 Tax=Haliotis asinina TaxID=109174 RepID=UPI0035322B41